MAEATTPAALNTTGAGPTKSRQPVLTDDVRRFMKSLSVGDILLFDSLHLLSNLVKLSENRPVNHAAVYLGDDEIAHVGRHTPDPDPDKPPLVPAARIQKLSKRLCGAGGRADRTVTAMRHHEITKASAAKVVEVARSMTDPKLTRYDYGSLLVLMVPSLMRSYGERDAGDAPTGMMSGKMLGVARWIAAALAEADEEGAGHGPTLTCSEFVYRCFVEADQKLSIKITEPIGRWMNPKALREPPDGGPGGGSPPDGGPGGGSPPDGGPGGGSPPDGGPGGGSPPDGGYRAGFSGALPPGNGDDGEPWGGAGQVIDGDGLIAFGDTFRSGILRIEPLSGLTFDVTGAQDDLAVLAGRLIVQRLNGNRDKGKYRTDPTVATGALATDGVTPRDLWSSPSLSAVAVLHLPPGPLDDAIDQKS